MSFTADSSGAAQRTVERALATISAASVLWATAAFGAAMLVADPSPRWLALALLGVAGGLQSFHGQRKAELIQRCQAPRDKDLIFLTQKAHPKWRPQILKQFLHGGLKFRSIGFLELPIPLAVTLPLCPRCAARLTQRATVRFPGRVRIEHLCGCGFAQRSTHTLEELRSEADYLAGTPA